MKHFAAILVVLMLVVLGTDELSAQSVSSASQTVTFSVQRSVSVASPADASLPSSKSLKVTVGSDEHSRESDIVASSLAIRAESSVIGSAGNPARTILDEDKQGKGRVAQSPYTYTSAVGKSIITVTE